MQHYFILVSYERGKMSERLFVIHRYGLPVNFQAMLLQPNKKNMKKLREVVYDLYKHLDSSAAIIDVSPLHTLFDSESVK